MKPRPLVTLAVVLTLGALVFLVLVPRRDRAVRQVPYSELVAAIESSEVAEVVVESGRLVAVIGEGEAQRRMASDRPPGVDDTQRIEGWIAGGVTVHAHNTANERGFLSMLACFAPLLLALVFWGGAMRSAAGGRMSFSRGRPRLFDERTQVRVTFGDVAGVDEAKAELREVIGYLRDPGRYQAIGAQMPKGTLLAGPPGTGKTLLARAVAGEADVPFFSISGSEFVEMFVGVGAARVRDLFDQARAKAPCIVFIDELDAIGRTRGGLGTPTVNDEREQTLNQLLVELDGFDPSGGVVIMAATNRPEILDPALLRAGRFDRRVLVDRPDVAGRAAILAVHARKVSLADVDLDLVARATSGMVGADLARVVNEAALAAVRRSAPEVEQRDFDEAIERIELGLEQRSRVLREREKERVAFHESGHALVAMVLPTADPVQRVTIVPRSMGSLGSTLQVPVEDRYLITRGELLDQLAVMLAGRASEELFCGDISSGAESDLERASWTARVMVTRYGMSDALGLTTLETPGLRFLDTPWAPTAAQYGEQTAEQIDAEVRRILDEQRERARSILTEREAAVRAVAARLLTVETLDRTELEALVSAATHGEHRVHH